MQSFLQSLKGGFPLLFRENAVHSRFIPRHAGRALRMAVSKSHLTSTGPI
jgi:hypothetical protein